MKKSKFGALCGALVFTAGVQLLDVTAAYAWSFRAADSFGWIHSDRLKSGDVEIQLDYQRGQPIFWKEGGHTPSVNVAKPVWFNVKAPFAESVSIEVNFYEQRYTHVGPNASLYRSYRHFDRTVQLYKTPSGEFSGATDSLAVERNDSASSDGYYVYQKLRVLVNGVPLKDPVSQTEWFQVLLINK